MENGPAKQAVIEDDYQLLANLTAEETEVLLTHGIPRSYPKGAIVINEGDESDCLYVIRSGQVKVYVSDDKGKEATLSFQGTGEYFGELALFDNEPRSASVVTMQPCQMVVVSRSAFRRCIAEHPGLAINIIRSLSHRVRYLTERLKNLALLDVYGRVTRCLQELSREGEDGTLVLQQRLTHQDIANMVGASREMVSRIMKDLVDGGYISVRDRIIIVNGKLPAAW